MSNTKKWIVGLCASALLTPIAQAADLADIYNLSVNNDPQLAAAKATYMATRESVPQARAGLLPNISASGSTSDVQRTVVNSGITTDFNEHSWQAVLVQPLFRLDRWFQFKSAKNIEAGALAQFASEQQELIFRVADSYLTILEANSQLVSSIAERDAVKRQLEQVQQRFDVGLVAITDVLESTAAYDSSTVNVIEAEGRQNISFETLLRITGEPFNDVEGLAEEFPVEYPEPNNEDAWVKRALEGNYALLAAAENVTAAQRNLYAAKSGHLPTVDAQIIYGEQVSGGASFLGSEVEQRSAQLVLNVPIFSGLKVLTLFSKVETLSMTSVVYR